MSFPIAKPITARLETTRARALRGKVGPVLVGVLAAAQGACAISMPIASLVTPVAHDDGAGTIERPSLARLLEAEDLRRAEAALATALDPRANGMVVAWENPQSGAKGSFTPRGNAYPDEARICRGFASEIDRKGATSSLRGTACADKGGAWTVAGIDPAKGIAGLD